MTADELRRAARDLHGEMVEGRPVDQRPGQLTLGEIPAGPGVVVRVVWSPSIHRVGGAVFIQALRRGPGRLYTSASGSLRIDDGSLPGFANAIAAALDLAAGQFRRVGRSPRRGDDQHHGNGHGEPPPPSSNGSAVTPTQHDDHEPPDAA
jgi:hypothetical protein